LGSHGSWVGPFIDGVGYFGTVVFAVSGALAAGRYKMDPIGFIVLGTVTAIGGGTIRALLLDQPVSWVQAPGVLGLTVGVSLITYFFIPGRTARWKALTWFDALGLAAFSVTGTQAALAVGAGWQVAIAMGVISATGGGVLRDLLANELPFVLRGELYASTALVGAGTVVGLTALDIGTPVAMIGGFVATLALRGSAIVFGLELGAPGQWWRTSRSQAAGPMGEIPRDDDKRDE
jgi:uncharacterized membrane protein YeiH